MSSAIGAELTAKWLGALTRATTFRVRGQGRKFKRSARATFEIEPVRSEDSPEVRAACLWLLCVLECFRAGSQRAMGPKLWVGVMRGEKGKLGYWGLADKVHRSPAELARYLAVARSAGIFHDWQAKGTDVPAALKGRVSGHAYATYELLPEMPRQLTEHLQAFYGDPRTKAAEKAAEQATLLVSNVAPGPRPAPRKGPATDPATYMRLVPPAPD